MTITVHDPITVDAQVEWDDTGIDINEGEHLTFNATGNVKPWSSYPDPGAGPNGHPDDTYDTPGNGVIFPGVRFMKLVGRVSTTTPTTVCDDVTTLNPATECFAIGAEGMYVAQNSGRLYLSTNDVTNAFASDNEGSFTVNLTVKSGSDIFGTSPCSFGGNGSGNDQPETEDPISLRLGEKREQITDLRVATPNGELALTRLYRQSLVQDTSTPDVLSSLGLGWSHNHNIVIDNSDESNGFLYVWGENVSQMRFTETVTDTFKLIAGGTSQITVDSGSTSARYTLDATDQTFVFDSDGKLQSHDWSNGETWTYSYYTSIDYKEDLLEKVADGYGRELKFSYINNSGQFDHKKLWRIGDHNASGLDSGSPTGRYVEFDYAENKIEDSQNPGTTINGGQALLSSVQDVLGKVWVYEHEQSDILTLNWMIRAKSPLVDTDGDDTNDESIILKDLEYWLSGSDITAITQKLGGTGQVGSEVYEQQVDFIFQPNGENSTIETTAGRDITHSFIGEMYGGAEDALGNSHSEFLGNNYRSGGQQDANGNATYLAWINNGKTLTSVTDADGNTTSFTYDSSDRLLTSADAESRKTEYTYDDVTYPDLRQPETIKIKDASNNLLRMQEFAYDTKGRTTSDKEIDPSDETTVLRETTRSFYTTGDGNGLLEKVTFKDQDASNDQETTYTYDSVGQVIQVNKNSTFGNCLISRTVYDVAGNVVASICNYDNGAYAHPTTAQEASDLYDLVADPDKNQVTTHTYDAMGRRVATTSNAGNATLEKTTQIVYDALNRVTYQIGNYINPLVSSVPTYEAPGGWVFESGVWKDEPSGVTISHGTDLNENIISRTEYNERGLVRLTQDHLGNVVLYGYDDADRLVKTIQNATATTYNNDYSGTPNDPDLSEYTEDTTAESIDIITEQFYDAVGNLVKTLDPAGRVSYTVYDALNRPVKVVQNAKATATIDLGVGDVGYDPNLDPRSSSYVILADSDRDQVSETEYDTLGRVTQTQRLLDVVGTTETWSVTRFVYDSLGRQNRTIQNYVAQISGEDPSLWVWDGTTDNRWEESDGTAIKHDSANYVNDQNLIEETFYNAEGQVSHTIDIERRETHFAYDGLQRQELTVGNFVDGSPTAYQTIEDWEWSGSKWQDGATPTPIDIDFGSANDENILSKTTYDADGYVTFTRDVDGRIQRFVYDALGRQIRTIQNYIEQGSSPVSDPKDWVWDDSTTRWEYDGANQVGHGTNDDENIISDTIYDDQGRVQSTRDHLGNVTLYGYDSANRRIKVIQNTSDPYPVSPWADDLSDYSPAIGADGDQDRDSSTVYDGAGRVQSTVGANSNTAYFVYDDLGRRIRTVQNYVSNGESPSLWVWDATDNRYEESDGTAIAHTIEFDQNLITETVYNKAGQVVSTRDARGTTTTFVYDDSGRRVSVTQATNTGLASISYTCFDKAGRVLRTIANWIDDGTDPDDRNSSGVWAFNPTIHGRNNDQNIITLYEYDSASRRVKVTNPNGDNSQTTYFKDGTVDTVTDPEGTITAYRYDSLRRRTRVVQNYVEPVSAEDPSLWVWDGVTDNRWEESGGTTAIAHGANSDQNIIVDVDYDTLGRMEQMRDPRGNLTSYTYDQLGRRTKLTNPLSKEWATTYANVGNVSQTTMNYPGINGGASYNVVRDFDRLGRLTEIDYADLTNTPTVQFAYNSDGNRETMTEIGSGSATIRETTYGYDGIGRLTSVGFDTDGDSTVDETVSYTYDIAGNRTELKLPNNDVISYQYDDKGRLISMTDWDNQTSTFQYDKLGRHVGTQRNNGFYSRYTYNKAGHLQELRHGEGYDTVKTLQSFVYTTDKLGNRTQAKELSLRATAGSSVTMAHDDERIVYTGDWDANGLFHETTETNVKLAVMFYGNTGINLTMGTGADCGIYDVYINQTLWQSYDGYASSAGEDVIALEVKGSGAHLLEVYQRREKNSASSGYKVRFKQLVALEAYDVDTIDYTYDNLSRLLEADYVGGSTYTYGYDLAGNLVNNNGVTNTFNDANQLTGDGTDTFDYDANGNLWKTNSVVSHTWDRANRLLSHGGLDYLYDGNGARIQKTVSSVVTDYLLDVQRGLTQVLRESDGTNTNHYIHSPRGIHAMNDGTNWSYMLQDGLGSVRAEIAQNMAVNGSQSYAPYGEVFGASGSMSSPFAFTGEPLDGNGLQYHRARYYAPEMGVWASLDPLETLNRYMYVAGNPTNLIDPTGLYDTTLIDAFGKFGQQLAQNPGIQLTGGSVISSVLTVVGAAVSAEALAVGTLIALPAIGFTYGLFNPIEPHWLTEWIEAAPVAPDAMYKSYGSSQTDVFPTGATPYDYMEAGRIAPTTLNPPMPPQFPGIDPEELVEICNSGFCDGDLSRLLESLGLGLVLMSTLVHHSNVKLKVDHKNKTCVGVCPSGGFDHCRVDRVDPPGKSAVHYPHPGDHVHIYSAEYNFAPYPRCECFAKPVEIILPLPPGGMPPIPPCTSSRTRINMG